MIGLYENTIDANPSAAINNHVSIGSKDILIAKYNSAFNYIWSNSIGTTDWDQMYDLEINSANEIWIGGALKGVMDADPGAGVTNLAHVGSDDICVIKYSSSGAFQNGFLLWISRFGPMHKPQVESSRETVQLEGYLLRNNRLRSMSAEDHFIHISGLH
jgi:hypothetical protein